MYVCTCVCMLVCMCGGLVVPSPRGGEGVGRVEKNLVFISFRFILFLHANVTCHLCVCAAGLYRVWCGLCRSMSLISKV